MIDRSVIAYEEKQKILTFAQMIQSYLDHPAMLKKLHKCIKQETKIVSSDRYDFEDETRNHMEVVLMRLNECVKKLHSSKNIVQYKRYDKQLTDVITELTFEVQRDKAAIEEKEAQAQAAATEATGDDPVKKNEKNLE